MRKVIFDLLEMDQFQYTLFFCLVSIAHAVPIVIKGSSPSGDAIIAISTNNPEVEKYLRFGFSGGPNGNQDTVMRRTPEELAKEIAIVEGVTSPGSVAVTAGSGRSFMSPSAFNPFMMPFLFTPLNLEGIGLKDFGSINNWVKGIEGFYDHGFPRDGEVKTVAAINENGHVYGNVRTLTFDNKNSH